MVINNLNEAKRVNNKSEYARLNIANFYLTYGLPHLALKELREIKQGKLLAAAQVMQANAYFFMGSNKRAAEMLANVDNVTSNLTSVLLLKMAILNNKVQNSNLKNLTKEEKQFVAALNSRKTSKEDR